MFIAQLKNKFTRPEEEMEDLLTSNVFGVWRYLPTQLGLVQFLETSERLDGAKLTLSKEIVSANFQFWPWFKGEVNSKAAEPDVLIELNTSDHGKVLIIIESKFLSSKSSIEDESDLPNDQLAREMCILRKLSKERNLENYALIYVTSHTRLPSKDILKSASELLKKTGDASEGHLYWTTWRRLPEILNRELFSEAKKISPGYETMLKDLKEIITRLKLTFFEGFSTKEWTFIENRWCFEMLQPSFTWSSIKIIDYKFSEKPTSFKWSALESKKLWRFSNGNV